MLRHNIFGLLKTETKYLLDKSHPPFFLLGGVGVGASFLIIVELANTGVITIHKDVYHK